MVIAQWSIAILFVTIVIQRLVELRVAKHNEAWARAQGAREYGADHYPLFFVLHTAWLIAWPLEAWMRGPGLDWGWPVWLVVFAIAQVLRFSAITALGRRWNTRILVIPGQPLVHGGPYRFIDHPNYVAVVLELAAVPLVFGAWYTALVIGVLNLLLLIGLRIPIESRALQAATPSPSTDVAVP
jgi:methyltransferase